MNRFARIGFAALALSLGVLLAGCEGFDPTSFMDSDFFNTKKRLPGERKSVFPEGTPGVTQRGPKERFPGEAPGVTEGVPKELVKGYQPGEQVQAPQPQSTVQAQPDEPKPEA